MSTPVLETPAPDQPWRKPVGTGVFDRDVFTVQQLAEVLGVLPMTIRKACKEGSLRARNLGGQKGWTITKEAVLRWLQGEDARTSLPPS